MLGAVPLVEIVFPLGNEIDPEPQYGRLQNRHLTRPPIEYRRHCHRFPAGVAAATTRRSVPDVTVRQTAFAAGPGLAGRQAWIDLRATNTRFLRARPASRMSLTV